MKKLTITLASLLMTNMASADCVNDFDGLFESTNNFSPLPGGVVDATGARTLNDYATATANQLFFTQEGRDVMGDIYFWNFYGPFGRFGTAFSDPPPMHMYGYACNDIGQCVNTHVRMDSRGLSTAEALGPIGAVFGVLTGETHFFWEPTQYSIDVTDASGNRSDILEFSRETIEQQQADQNPYDLSTAGRSRLSTKCKNNYGESLGSGSGLSLGGGSTRFARWSWDFNVPSGPPAPSYSCRDDFSSRRGSGVICSRGR